MTASRLLPLVTFLGALGGCGRMWYSPLEADRDDGGGSDGAAGAAGDGATDAPADDRSGVGGSGAGGGIGGGDAGADLASDGDFDGTTAAGGATGAGGDTGVGGATGVGGMGVGGMGVGGMSVDGATGTGGATADGGSDGVDGGGGAVCTPGTNAGHAYAFCTGPLPWSEAGNDCALKGMHLVRIDDAAENAYIEATAFVGVAINTVAVWRWLGATDQATEGEWRWYDGTLFWLGAAAGTAQAGLYSNWASAQPNDSGGAEDCASLQNNVQASWQDIGCQSTQPYVCEQ